MLERGLSLFLEGSLASWGLRIILSQADIYLVLTLLVRVWITPLLRGFETSLEVADYPPLDRRLSYLFVQSILSLLVMAGGQDVSTMESPESKIDTILNAINALSARLMDVEGVVHNTSSVGAASS